MTEEEIKAAWDRLSELDWIDDWKNAMDELRPRCKGHFEFLLTLAQEAEEREAPTVRAARREGRDDADLIRYFDFVYFLAAFALIQESEMPDTPWKMRVPVQYIAVYKERTFLLRARQGYNQPKTPMNQTIWSLREYPSLQMNNVSNEKGR